MGLQHYRTAFKTQICDLVICSGSWPAADYLIMTHNITSCWYQGYDGTVWAYLNASAVANPPYLVCAIAPSSCCDVFLTARGPY